VSDTPRTDSLLTAILDIDGYVAHRNCPPQWVYYARELERELNAANARIKRLEEAGDVMASILNNTRKDWYTSDQCEVAAFNWNEAKEAKP